MAIFHSWSASNSHPSMSMNIFLRINKTNPIPIIASSNPTAHKWSIVEDIRLTSNPSNNTNYLTGFRSPNNAVEVPARHEQKLKEVRNMLREEGEDPLEGLLLIESLQRLGIDYHFQEDIEAILKSQYEKSRVHGYSEDDLFTVSTRFRLLRQEGYHVPADVFKNFMDKEGRFKTELRRDIRGLLGLYEASQLSIEGEDILDQAAEFSAQLLSGCNIRHLNHHQARVVHNTLAHPYHKSLASLMAKNFLSDYKGQNRWVNVLQEFAQMDFSMVRTIRQKEILRVFKWWKDTGLAKELKFARDQPLKWYMWPMASLSDPRFSEERFELTKPISFIYIIDDIFDVHGTLEELTLFTEAVNRWELADVEQLPKYMKICFKALHDITDEIAYKVYKEHGYNPIDSLRRSWASLCNAFLVEAKWFASGRLPKAEEYLKNGIVSSGMHVVLVHMFSLLGHGINKECVNLLNDNPGIIASTATILRLWDDLGSAKDENQDGHDGSYMQCCMKDHKGLSVETARKQVTHLISEAWKLLNQECLTQTRFSANFKKGCLNMARMVPLMYSYDDNQSLPILEEHMKTMLYDTAPLQRREKYF